MTVVYETAPLPGPRGGTVTLRLRVEESDGTTAVRIESTERLIHKVRAMEVLRISEPTQGIAALARAMTSITHDLERLHRLGCSLRERAAGGWRGAWHCDLLGGDGVRALAAWEIEPRKPWRTLEPLAHLLATLERPRPVPSPDGGIPPLVESLREHGDEIRRGHQVDALIAADPFLPGSEFVQAVERMIPDPPSERSES